MSDSRYAHIAIQAFFFIYIIDKINACTLCEHFPDVSKIFERDAITVTLEWIQGNSSYSYYISIIPTAQLLVNFNEITRVTVCKDMNNVTVACNEIGNREPITPTDECTDKSGMTLTMIMTK